MPRGARIGVSAQIYHVITRGNNRQWVFQEDEDFCRYLETVGRYKERGGFKLYHWVLMNNHVHLLLEVDPEGSLSKAMQGINLSYTLWFHRKYRRVGHLWQDRFKSFLVEKDGYLLECGRYIERNPLRAGLVSDPGAYRWSSFRFHAEGLEDGVTDRHPFIEDQFSSGASYREYVCTLRDDEDQTFSTRGCGGIVGTDDFREQVRKELQARKKVGRGRPRKNIV